MAEQLDLALEFDDVPTNTAECPAPGIYRDVPFEEYASWKAFNSGVIKWGSVSLKHMKAAYDGRVKSEDTKDRKLGRAIHQRVLEPNRPLLVARSCSAPVKSRNGETCCNTGKYVSTQPVHIEDQFAQAHHVLTELGFELYAESDFGSRYYTHPRIKVRVSDHEPNEKTTNWLADITGLDVRVGGRQSLLPQFGSLIAADVEPLRFWYCGVHKPDGAVEPLDYVSEEEATRIEKIVAALHDHPAMPMLKRNGWSEVSIVWEWNGLLLKGRLDRYAEGPPPVVLDLKKIQVGKGSRDECQKVIVKNGYHHQGAIYAKGVQHFQGMLPAVIWVFQEDAEPFDAQIIMATPEEIEMAWQEVAERLMAFKRCQEANEFPGYVKVLRDGKIAGEPGACPAWWHKQRMEMRS